MEKTSRPIRTWIGMVFDAVVKEPLEPEKGYLPVPQRPGLGMELDEEKLKRFRIA